MSASGSRTGRARWTSTRILDFASIPTSATRASLRSSPATGRASTSSSTGSPEQHVLLDEPVKWPGYTHGAFVVESLQAVIDWATREGIAITEGPVDWDRRLTCFLRDPDGNVLEFNELKAQASTDQGALR